MPNYLVVDFRHQFSYYPTASAQGINQFDFVGSGESGLGNVPN
jgi:hypothetical protein